MTDSTGTRPMAPTTDDDLLLREDWGIPDRDRILTLKVWKPEPWLPSPHRDWMVWFQIVNLHEVPRMTAQITGALAVRDALQMCTNELLLLGAIPVMRS